MFLTLQLWDFLVIIPLVSAQVPNMSHLKGFRAVIKIIMFSFVMFAGNIWYYHHHQYSPSNAWSVISLPRTNFMTFPPSVSPVIPNVEAPREKQKAIEELRSNARTSRRISSNFSKKVLGKNTNINPKSDDVDIMKAKNKTRQIDQYLINLPPDAVLVGYEEESDEKTTFRTTPSDENKEDMAPENNDPSYRDRGKDSVVVQSLLRSSSLLTTPSSWVRPGPRPVYNPNMKKKVKRISPASTNITVVSPSEGLSLLPAFPLVTESPKTKTSVLTVNQTLQTQTTTRKSTTTSELIVEPETNRAGKRETFKHAETQKLISGGETSKKTNFIILGIVILSFGL